RNARLLARLRADGLGRYPSISTAARMRSRISFRTFGSLLSTRETVFGDTPASRATSSMRALIGNLPWYPSMNALFPGSTEAAGITIWHMHISARHHPLIDAAMRIPEGHITKN